MSMKITYRSRPLQPGMGLLGGRVFHAGNEYTPILCREVPVENFPEVEDAKKVRLVLSNRKFKGSKVAWFIYTKRGREVDVRLQDLKPSRLFGRPTYVSLKRVILRYFPDIRNWKWMKIHWAMEVIE